MIPLALLASWIVCAEPRLNFNEFHTKLHGGILKPMRGEQGDAYIIRSVEAMSNYIEYSELYRDKCK